MDTPPPQDGVGDLDRWRKRLDAYQQGRTLQVDANWPEPGYYSIKLGDKCVGARIWQVDDSWGQPGLHATLNGMSCLVRAIWPRCAATPVTAAAYRWWAEKGEWPGDPQAAPSASDPPAVTPHLYFTVRLANLESTAIAWMESIGGAVRTGEHVKQANSYWNALIQLRHDAQETKQTALKPLIDALEAERAAWTKIEKCLEDMRKTINHWPMAESGPPNNTKIETARPRHFVAVSDVCALLRWLGDPANNIKLSVTIKTAANLLARRLVRAGKLPDGVETREKE